MLCPAGTDSDTKIEDTENVNYWSEMKSFNTMEHELYWPYRLTAASLFSDGHSIEVSNNFTIIKVAVGVGNVTG